MIENSNKACFSGFDGIILYKTRQDKTRQDKTRQDKTDSLVFSKTFRIFQELL